MNKIVAKYASGQSVWDLDQLGIDPAAIDDYDIKWDTLTIWSGDQEQEYAPTAAVAVYDCDQSWIKHPVSVEASFTIRNAAFG